jgi:hypothetical protein
MTTGIDGRIAYSKKKTEVSEDSIDMRDKTYKNNEKTMTTGFVPKKVLGYYIIIRVNSETFSSFIDWLCLSYLSLRSIS